MNKLSCEIVRDLLPSYVEGLTSQVTSDAVKAHLEDCEECRTVYEAMKTGDGAEAAAEDGKTGEAKAAQEINYMKKIRSKFRKKTVICVIGALLLVTVGILWKVFIYGSPYYGYELKLDVVKGDESNGGPARVYVEGILPEKAFSRYKIVEKNGYPTLVVYAAQKAPWNQAFLFRIDEEIPEEGLVINDHYITAEGQLISHQAYNLLEAKTPYVGDAPAVGSLISWLDLWQNTDYYDMKLHTEKEPYGVEIRFKSNWNTLEETLINTKMEAYSCVILALIDNCEEVYWSYTVEGEVKRKSFTTGDAAVKLGYDVKTMNLDNMAMQEMLEDLGIAAFAETPKELFRS